MDITKWSIPNQIDYIPCSRKCRNCTQTVKTRPGADCGSDHQLLIAKFRLKLKKAGKSTRPVRCKLNQISYKYTVEVMNRFRGLDLVRRMSEELWTRSIILYRKQHTRPFQRKGNASRQSGCLRKLCK